MSFTLEKVNVHHKPDKREKIIFFLTLAGFLLAFVKACWLPSLNAISDVNDEIKELKETQITVEQQTTTSKQKQTQMQTKRPLTQEENKLNSWASRLAQTPDVFLMKEFSNPAKLKDLTLKNIAFVDTAKEEGVTKQGFTLFLEGSFLSVENYLNKIERLPILVIIHNINLNVTNDSFGRIQAEFTGTAYGW